MKINKYLCALAIAGACSASLSAATLSFNLVEPGVNTVNLTVSGSISSLAGWTFVTSFKTGQYPSIQPNVGTIASFGGESTDFYMTAATTPYSIGSSASIYGGNRISGDTVGFQAKQGGDSYLFLPKGYVPGTAINSSSQWIGQTFSSMGLTSGTSYSWTAGPDTIQFNVGAASIPEPSAFVMLGLGAIGLVARRRRVG
jgi:hypothetical protein